MKRGSSAASIIGGIILLTIAAWGISEGRLPTTSQMVGDVVRAETPEIFWGYVIDFAAIGTVALIWGLVASRRR